MYDELYAAWRLEIENAELGSLPPDFYARVADYLRRLKEENHMQEQNQKTLKTTLLAREQANVIHMTRELIAARYRKLAKMIVAGKTPPMDCLASEEQKLCTGIVPSAEAFNRFAAGLLEGKLFVINVEAPVSQTASEPPVVHKRVTLRFLKPVPSIIGSDMKSYGPFLVEDVASVPTENAKILVKQGLAKQIDLQ
jgi:DNA replication initiation complex subunit (GINS family)